MLDAFFGRFTVSKIFNILPTQSRRRLETFKARWEKLNLDIIAKARTVWQDGALVVVNMKRETV